MTPSRSLARRAVAWSPPLALAWWVVSEGRPGSWGVGIPAVAAAALAAALVVPAGGRGPRPAALLRLAAFFAHQAVRGGWRVARLALSPALRLSPGFAELRTTLPEGGARVLLADVVSLLPGTVTIDLEGDRLLVHGLDAGPALEAGVRDLERRVAALWPPGGGGAA